MIVHGSSVSPYVRKVLVYAAEKGIAIENRPVGLGPKTPEFMAMSPFGKIPAFEDGDYSLSDSTAIVTYLETKHPEPSLIPSEARARGKAIWFDELADTILFATAAPIFFNRVLAPLLGMPQDLAAADTAERDALPKILDYIERALPESGHLVEDRMTIADISVACPFVNLMYASVAPDAATYPALTAFLAAMHARPGFVAGIESDRRQLRL